MIDHEKIVYLPTSTVTQMMADGKKSFNIKMLNEKLYNIIEIPAVKKRSNSIFLTADYSILTALQDGE